MARHHIRGRERDTLSLLHKGNQMPPNIEAQGRCNSGGPRLRARRLRRPSHDYKTNQALYEKEEDVIDAIC